MLRAKVHHGGTELIWLDGWKANELAFDGLEKLSKAIWQNEAITPHAGNVMLITRVVSLQFGEGLTVEIVVIEADASMLSDETAAILPTR